MRFKINDEIFFINKSKKEGFLLVTFGGNSSYYKVNDLSIYDVEGNLSIDNNTALDIFYKSFIYLYDSGVICLYGRFLKLDAISLHLNKKFNGIFDDIFYENIIDKKEKELSDGFKINGSNCLCKFKILTRDGVMSKDRNGSKYVLISASKNSRIYRKIFELSDNPMCNFEISNFNFSEYGIAQLDFKGKEFGYIDGKTHKEHKIKSDTLQSVEEILKAKKITKYRIYELHSSRKQRND